MRAKTVVRLCLVFILVFVLTGCIKSKQPVNTTRESISQGVVVENGIVDLSPEDSSETVDESASEEEIVNLGGLDDITNADDTIETDADIKNKLPKNVLVDEDKIYYDFDGVKVQFEDGLVKDEFVDMQDSYVSEDGKTYLMHEVSDIEDIDINYIEKRFEKNNVPKSNIFKGMIGDYSYIMAVYDEDETTNSCMAYVFVNDVLHIFTVAKEGATASEIRYLVSDMLESAKFEDIEVEEIDKDTDVLESIYWEDNSEIVEDTVEVVINDVVHTKIGSNWNLLDETNNVYHCGSSTYTVSMKFISADTEEDIKAYMDGYRSLLYNTFGEPVADRQIRVIDDGILWDEYAFKDTDYNGQHMNIGAYVGKTAKGIFYVEFSCIADKEMQYNYIMTVLENTKV